LESIKRFTSLVINSGVPEEIRPVFFGASLTALKKKSGGIRPIAVGNVWRRLAGKVLVSRIIPKLIPFLSPHQLGAGVE